MKRNETSLPGVILLEPKIWKDDRGYFYESYNKKSFEKIGIDIEFVQDNISNSRQGALRGLHYQIDKPQAKLIQCIRGEIFDVVVDIRRGSPAFGKWLAFELSEDNQQMLFIPAGFAHGFYTLSADAKVHYKCDNYYYPEGERGIIWDDPALAIAWPLLNPEPLISAKDLSGKPLAQIDPADLPTYEGS